MIWDDEEVTKETGEDVIGRRVVTLATNLCLSPQGKTRSELFDLISDYQGENPDSQRRTFERDIAALRSAGLQITVEVEADRDSVYRVDGSSFPRHNVEFTSKETRALLDAAGAWRQLPAASRNRLRNKLMAYTTGNVTTEPAVFAELDQTDMVAEIFELIKARQPISFTYRSPVSTETRDVFPWAVRVRGTATYLYGLDVNREEPRTFRLSRIVSPLTKVGESDFFDLPANLDDSAYKNFFLVSPLMWVRQGTAPQIRIRSGQPLAHSEYPPHLSPKVGWDLLRGISDDREMWERTILENCLNTVPQEPEDFRLAVQSKLEVASQWGKNGWNSNGRQ